MAFKRRSLVSLLLASTVGLTVAVTGWAASAGTSGSSRPTSTPS